MRLLIIPGLPLATIYGSRFIGAHLPPAAAYPVTFILFLTLSYYLLLWFMTGHRPRL